MTDQPEVRPDQAAQAPDADGAGRPVVRDKRRVRATPAGGTGAAQPAATAPAEAASETVAAEVETVEAEDVAETAEPGPEAPAEPQPEAPAEPQPEAPAEPQPEVPAEPEPEVTPMQAPGGFAAELEAVRAELDERTRDLQRLSAEYANYRKRVKRDRALIGEQATANVLTALLPVLDDLERAREHGELAEGVSAVVDQLTAITQKFGLSTFGEKGDPFDPNRHEAVAHQTSADVSEPTCVDILRRGYLLGDRLLRPAMVAVADPE